MYAYFSFLPQEQCFLTPLPVLLSLAAGDRDVRLLQAPGLLLHRVHLRALCRAWLCARVCQGPRGEMLIAASFLQIDPLFIGGSVSLANLGFSCFWEDNLAL
jgi:hypothetical protein